MSAVSASTDVTIDGLRAENNSSSQIYFTGNTNFEYTNWETGESYVLNTDDWTVVNSTFAAFGSQVIVDSRLPPAIIWSENNVCITDNPVPTDSLVCE